MGQRHERVHHVVILLRQLTARRKRRLSRHRDMRMLRRPYRLETALLERPGQLARAHRVVGKKHRRAKQHGWSPKKERFDAEVANDTRSRFSARSANIKQ